MSKLRVDQLETLDGQSQVNISDLVNPNQYPVTTATGNQTLADALDQRVIRFSTVAEMKALPTTDLVDGQQALVKGYYAGSDEGGGLFYWDINRTAEDDDGSVIGGWVRQGLTHVSYRMFGAKLDGVTDDWARVVAAHQFANAEGLPIREAGGVAFIAPTSTLSVQTDCEWMDGFKFYVPNPPTSNIFIFDPEYTVTNLTQADVTLSEFQAKNRVIASLSAYPYHYAVVDSTEFALRRVGGQEYTKKSVTVIGEGGEIFYPLVFSFGSISNIKLTPINIEPRVIKGLTLEIDGTSSLAHPFKVTRNRVRFEDPRYIDGGATASIPVRQLFTLVDCYDIEILDAVSDTLSEGRVDYNYVINGDGYARLRVRGMRSFEGWAQIDGNNCRDVLVDDSALYRAGGHFNCWDYTFRDITCNSDTAIAISGGGRLDISNINISPVEMVDTCTVAAIRQDYGAQWDGAISIRGVTVDLSGVSSAGTVHCVSAYLDSNAVLNDFGQDLVLPRSVDVEDVTILLQEASTNIVRTQAVRIGGFGSTLAGGRKFFYPTVVAVKNVKKAKGSKAVNNEVNSAYIVGTIGAVGTNNEMKVLIDNVDRDDPRFASLNPYDGGQLPSFSIGAIPDLTALVDVVNCEWLRADFSAAGRCKIGNCSVAAISGNGRYELYDNQYLGSSFSGTWKGMVGGGEVRAYLGTDSAYKQVGFPNNIEDNIAACRGLFVEVNGAIRSATQTVSTVQTGFYDTVYYQAP